MPPSPTRPRRSSATRRPSATDRRAQILREALRCFASTGFRGTTTRDIASAVGITEAAFYRHFPSKQALHDAIIDEKIAAPPVYDLVEVAHAQRDDDALFSALARGILERGLADPDFVRLFFFTALEGHELSDSFLKSHVGGLRSFVTGYIRMRIADGVFRDRDPSQMGLAQITDRFRDQGLDAVGAEYATRVVADRMLTAQAMMEAFHDAFFFIAVCFVVGFPLGFLIARHMPGKYAPIE